MTIDPDPTLLINILRDDPMTTHPVRRTDGQIVHVTIPARPCQHCEGDGRRWDEDRQRFGEEACAWCEGTGEEGGAMNATQDQIDRANEWTAEHYPSAEGAEYEARLADALADIIRCDADADASEMA